MRVLSAAEAISPAIDRTRAILFQPFRKGRSWKLAAVAYLSAMGLAFIPYPLFFIAAPIPPGQNSAQVRLLLAAACLFATAVFLLFFYIGSRLQFVLFALVSEKSDIVAPLWKRYGSRTWPWLGLKLALSLIVSAVCGLPLFYLFRAIIQQGLQPGQPPSPEVVFNIILLYGFILLPILLLVLCSSLLSDFVLPPIALEGASISDALGRFFELIKAEPGQIFFYTVFKILLAIAGMMVVQVVVMLAELLVFIPLGLLGLLGWFLFRSMGPVGHLLLAVGGITLGLALTVLLFYLIILVLGCTHMFYQAYALYFLGGRYPLLGDLLEPPAPPTPEPPQEPPPYLETVS